MCSHQSTVSKLLQICCHGPKLLLLEFLYLHLDKTGIEQEPTLCMDHVLRSDVHDYCRNLDVLLMLDLLIRSYQLVRLCLQKHLPFECVVVVAT